ncbi:MAG TPA: hypothetical protein VMU50_07095, partial [Polyangia bacterium]|nr:hypothetical protein [Polyangia bacterium]
MTVWPARCARAFLIAGSLLVLGCGSGGATIKSDGGGGANGAGGAGGSTTDAAAGDLGGKIPVGKTQCSDGIDNDGDGLIDYDDPECVGPLDNDEGSFATGIPGDNVDPCKQDCFFDGNSGMGNDGCDWQLKCDPLNTGATAGSTDTAGGTGTAGATGTGGAGGSIFKVPIGMTQCSDGIDNDGDGLIDSADPECTGPADNDESSFATGIPGDNMDACKQDCFFDGNSRLGDDGCQWQLEC